MPYAIAEVLVDLLDYDDGDNTVLVQPGTVADCVRERLIRFSFRDRVTDKDEATLVLRNDDRALFDEPAFVEGQKLLLAWGRPGSWCSPRRMIVTAVRGSNPIEVSCACPLHLMDRRKQHRYMAGVTDSEFVTKVAAEYGYRGAWAHVDATVARHDVTQVRDSTDARQLMKLAKRNGMDCYIGSDGFHWQRRRTDAPPDHAFTYRSDLGAGDITGEPIVSTDVSRDAVKVRVYGRDPETKRKVEYVAGPSNVDIVALAGESTVDDPDDAESGRRSKRVSREDVRYIGAATQEECQARAEAMYRDYCKRRYRLEMPVIGRGPLAKAQLIKLGGHSRRYDGLYYLEEVETSIQDGAFSQALHGVRDAQPHVPSAKKGIRRNVNAQPDLRPNMLSISPIMVVGPDGQAVVAYTWVDSYGLTAKLPSYVNPDQMSDQAYYDKYDRAFEILTDDYGQTVQPDCAM